LVQQHRCRSVGWPSTGNHRRAQP